MATQNMRLPSATKAKADPSRTILDIFDALYQARAFEPNIPSGGGSTSQKIALLVSQTGTNDPTTTVVYNDTGLTVTLGRGSAGNYFADLGAGAIDSTKTVVTNGGGTAGIVKTSTSSGQYLVIQTYDDAGVPADAILSDTSILVEIFA